MLRSMYSGISGMKNFQTKLDVIGNNIANVNTFGFKKGRVVFQDMLSQTTAGASAPTTNRGGVNPKQVGLGSQMAAIDTIDTVGSSQFTGRVLDLMIAGDGYFVVADGTKDTGGNITLGEKNYTRAGNLYLDVDGNLVNSDGMYVSGSDGKTINIPKTAKELTIGQDGKVNYLNDAGNIQTAGTLAIAKFSNPGGLQKVGSNLLKESKNSGAPLMTLAGQNGTGSIASSTLEMSNVDLSEEFTEMIVAQRGFQANTKIITTSDEILQELVNLKR
ncbi:flagellar basal body rod protein FlgG [Bacillus sp. 1P06AnD]|uniref:flagellar basal body rod protein FlgG n=1 Tax=Bacillus sp. 1P06AnD TaxID=3132208 RepID=UPI0039A16274